jgi:hypothetical protein
MAGLADDQILVRFEAMGTSQEGLLEIARELVQAKGDYLPEALDETAVCLALGSLQHWKPFRRLAEALFLHQCHPLAYAWFAHPPIDYRMLRRLGFPFPDRDGNLTERTRGLLSWLERGGQASPSGISLDSVQARAETWEIEAYRCLIVDSEGPRTLRFRAKGLRSETRDSLRLIRVARLESLLEPACGPALYGPNHPRLGSARMTLSDDDGTPAREPDYLQLFSLVAVDCPHLTELETRPSILVLTNCPQVRKAVCDRSGRLLHLDSCQNLRAIRLLKGSTYRRPQETHSGRDRKKSGLFQGSWVLARCPNLRGLPSAFQGLEGHLILRKLASFRFGSTPLRVGGNLRVIDCPSIEELPPLTVGGSLRVEGVSNMRSMGPSCIGKDLDLRACSHLGPLPSSMQVAGRILLPPHMQ